ncbi:MAG: hypothetical protein AAFZ11_02065 [Pseudomonadota bacterium]
MKQRDLFAQPENAETAGNPALAVATEAGGEPPELAPLGGTRSEAVQRLQIGLTGLCAMILMIGVAGVLGGQADLAEEAAVPDAAPTTEPTAAPPQRDPLADAGVVPDIPTEPDVEDPPVPTDTIMTEPDGAVTVPDTLPTEPQVDEDAP